MDENQLSNRVIGAAIEVHRVLGPGMLESAYQHCLARELSILEIPFRQEVPICLDYKGRRIHQAFRADFLVNGQLILELKAVDGLNDIHKSQLLTYLRWSNCRLGLLINFNAPLLKHGIARVVNNL